MPARSALFVLVALGLGCSTSSNPAASTQPDPPADAGVPADDAGQDAAKADCVPEAVPADVKAKFGLSDFYKQHVSLRGFPIIASEKTTPKALCVARDVVEKMLAHRPEITDRLVEKKIRLAVMARTELTTDIPEHSDLTPKDYWDQRARGLGATLARPAVSCAEENVLCESADRYKGESILVHEFSHAVFNIGIELFEPAMKTKLDKAFADATAAGLFKNTYAGSNADEYWAEGVQDWFDTNITKVPSDGIHNEIGTRTQLETYDPSLATLVAEVFGKLSWRYSCP